MQVDSTQTAVPSSADTYAAMGPESSSHKLTLIPTGGALEMLLEWVEFSLARPEAAVVLSQPASTSSSVIFSQVVCYSR